jgi:DNA invertase Pin-like site-specific DNA recombinase
LWIEACADVNFCSILMSLNFASTSVDGSAPLDLTIQQEALEAAGAEIIRSEKVSGTSMNGRTELINLLDFLRDGNTLLITRVDRLARSVKDLQDIVHHLRERGVELKATEQPVDTFSAAGNMFISLLGVFASFETELRKERQMEGIAKAKELGKYRGRQATIDVEAINARKADGAGATAIAREMYISVSSVYLTLVA